MTMTAPFEFGILSFSSLFAMVNPVSAAPIFVQLTQKRQDRRKQAAFRASFAALVAMGLFAVAGGGILTFFGVTVPAFQIAGGLLFLISSLRVLQGLPEHASPESDDSADPSIVPIGIPLIAGAGALSTVMVLAGQAQGRLHQLALGAAIVGNVVATLVVLLLAPRIVAKMGASGQEVLSKVMGLLTAVIGVQFILNGGAAAILMLAHTLGH